MLRIENANIFTGLYHDNVDVLCCRWPRQRRCRWL